jgi:exopolysaccharide biosynthesis WecB/TagA/CpsF family protein
VAELAARKASDRFPGIRICGTHPGYLEDGNDVALRIREAGPDLLLVGMGVPLQETWIGAHREELGPVLCLGVGAFLDYLSGALTRAPAVLRRLRLEWAWRILVDPKRMVPRYLVHGVGFLFRLVWLRVRGGGSWRAEGERT